MPGAAFVGWYGPIAVAAMYYAAVMAPVLGEPLIWHVTSLMVFVSVIVHVITATPLTRWYGQVAGEQTQLVLDDGRAAVGAGQS